MSSGVPVSLVMPTFNGMRTLPGVLAALRSQRGGEGLEIVAVDSSSTDGSAAFLESRGVRVIRIPRNAFNHGTSRNLGIRESAGDLIVLLVQDAIPANADWLVNLTTPLLDDASLEGTFARHVPHECASALSRHSLASWLASAEAPRIAGPLTIAEWHALSPAARHDLCVFDNVCSCIRRRAWDRHPFAEVAIAEDLQWARDVILDGGKIAFVPTALVRHSHDRGVAYEVRRTIQVHRRLNDLFGLRTVPSGTALLRSIASTVPAHARIARHEGARARARAVMLGVAWPLGQYLGARASGARTS